MGCKCKITCVKVWMCLAVFGCIMTLILAGIVLSSYSFETVIGPLPCKLNNIRISNCCYDSDCIYGKQYTYYFSSNSTHCMNKFDIYNHPTNKTVQFRDTTQCYPSLKSLDSSTSNWQLNDSIIFYVNRECTEWIESSEHHKQIERNLLWISIILTFVGCSCISMICGFITMYFNDILLCFIDYCQCNYCNKYIDDDDDYNQTTQNDIENRSSTSSNANNNNRQQQPYNKIHPRNNTKNNKFHPTPIDTKHKPIEYATHKHQQLYSKTVSRDSNHNNNNKYMKPRTRGHSNASKISKLSPLSDANDADGIIRQFVVDNGVNGNNKIKIRERQLKDRIYGSNSNNTQSHSNISESNTSHNNSNIDIHMTDINGYNQHLNVHMNDKHINDIIDDIASNGFSASVEFENEWYDENASKYTGVSTNTSHHNNVIITRKNNTKYSDESIDEYENEEEDNYTIDDDDHYQD